jgi:hypothetical protein
MRPLFWKLVHTKQNEAGLYPFRFNRFPVITPEADPAGKTGLRQHRVILCLNSSGPRFIPPYQKNTSLKPPRLFSILTSGRALIFIRK